MNTEMFLNGTSKKEREDEQVCGFCENASSWACFKISGLKDIFHWCVHFGILNKSFNCTTDTLTSSTTENMVVSSAKSFAVEEIFLLRSFT